MALIKPAALLDVAFTRDAVAEVVRLAAGYPYFLQEYGRELWNAAETSPITVADVDEVRDLVREQLARTFYAPASRWPATPSSATWRQWPRGGRRPTPRPRWPGAGGGEPAPDLTAS